MGIKYMLVLCIQIHGSLKLNQKIHLKTKYCIQLYQQKEDKQEWVEAIRVARNILSQPAMDPYNGGEISPGPSVQTDEEILDWVRKDGETALHPSCSAKMGPASDPMADPLTMKVHGMENYVLWMRLLCLALLMVIFTHQF